MTVSLALVIVLLISVFASATGTDLANNTTILIVLLIALIALAGVTTLSNNQNNNRCCCQNRLTSNFGIPQTLF